MIPDSFIDTPDEDPPNQTPLENVSTQSATTTKAVLPDAKSGSSPVSSKACSVTPLSDIPPRPSTAPPHSSADATQGKEPQADLQTRTTLVSHLRARNLLLQKAISHIDDAVLYLMAARSGIPSSKIQQVRGEARNRKDLLDRVDRAIKMAQNGELHEESQAEGEFRLGEESQRPSTESGPADTLQSGTLSTTTPPVPPNIYPLPSDASLNAPQLRRSSSQPHLGPSTTQPQAPTKVYTLPELIDRRKVLQESIESWQKFAAELRTAQPHLEARERSATSSSGTGLTPTSPASTTSSTQESSWTVKYQRAQFEIKRREDLLLRLNQAIAQVSHPTPEQFAALASYIPPALDKPRFDAAYAHYCQGKSIPMNTTIVMPDVSRPVIDIYALHVAVMQEGSFTRVSSRKSWDVVGGRLGFTRMAATASEPARSSPEIAVHLEKAYRDRLQQFDHLYVTSVIETLRKRMAEQQKKP